MRVGIFCREPLRMPRGAHAQVGRVFPELRANVTYLWENRRVWNDLHLAEVEADGSRSAGERAADRVRAAR